MKKISLALMILCSSTAALANSGQATIFNTSADGYMTVFYKICHMTQNQRTCEPTQSMTLMSAKWGQNYKVINVPVQADYDELSIENVIEKSFENGMPTQKVIAQTRSQQGVCNATTGSYGKSINSENLELTDMGGTPYVVCKRGFSGK